jgi:hypothetical protein
LFHQCVAVPPTATGLRLEAWVKADPPNGGAGAALWIEVLDSPDCSEGVYLRTDVRPAFADLRWHALSLDVGFRGTARSARVVLSLNDSPSASLDRVILVTQ